MDYDNKDLNEFLGVSEKEIPLEKLSNMLKEMVAYPGSNITNMGFSQIVTNNWTDPMSTYRLQQAKEKCLLYYILDPLHSRRVETVTSSIFAQGVKVTSNIDDDIWQRLWRTTNMELKLREFSNRIQVSGEAFVVIMVDRAGKITLLEFDPAEILYIVTEQGNYSNVLGYIRQGAETNYTAEGGVTTVNINRFYPIYEKLADGTVRYILHWKSLSFPSFLRGIPDTLPMLKATARYNRALDLTIKLLEALSAYGWKRTIQGADEAALEAKRVARMALGPREPGSEEIVNEYENIELISRSGGGGTSDTEIKRLLDNVIAASGLPEVLLTGDASNGNYASIHAQLKENYCLQEYKTLWRHYITQMHDIIFKLLGYQNKIDLVDGITCSIEFPKDKNEDLEATARAVSLLVSQGIISIESARNLLGFDNADEDEKIKNYNEWKDTVDKDKPSGAS